MKYCSLMREVAVVVCVFESIIQSQMCSLLRLGHSQTCQVWIHISVYRSVQCRPLSKYHVCIVCRECDEVKI